MSALDDYFILDDMKAALRRHLSAALRECAALARDLAVIDGDDVMGDLRKQFDAETAHACIQDCFSEGFTDHVNAVRDAGGEPLTARTGLPSGALV